MAHRFCSRCQAEVEDVGGYCLLGHNLRLEAATDTLSALRAEVNRTFDEAREQLAGVAVSSEAVATTTRATPPAPDVRPAPEAAVPPPPPPPAPSSETSAVVYAEEAAIVRQDAPAPANPSQGDHPSVWDALEDTPALAVDDPIASFAPAPRMDWGPSRPTRLRRTRSAPKVQPEG